jgi:hypothetical protein
MNIKVNEIQKIVKNVSENVFSIGVLPSTLCFVSNASSHVLSTFQVSSIWKGLRILVLKWEWITFTPNGRVRIKIMASRGNSKLWWGADIPHIQISQVLTLSEMSSA